MDWDTHKTTYTYTLEGLIELSDSKINIFNQLSVFHSVTPDKEIVVYQHYQHTFTLGQATLYNPSDLLIFTPQSTLYSPYTNKILKVALKLPRIQISKCVPVSLYPREAELKRKQKPRGAEAQWLHCIIQSHWWTANEVQLRRSDSENHWHQLEATEDNRCWQEKIL